MGSVIQMFDKGLHVPQRRRDDRAGEEREVCYCSSAHDEVSEVSCSPEPRVVANKRARERRRAS